MQVVSSTGLTVFVIKKVKNAEKMRKVFSPFFPNIVFNSLSTNPFFFTTLDRKTFENMVEKGKNAGN